MNYYHLTSDILLLEGKEGAPIAAILKARKKEKRKSNTQL